MAKKLFFWGATLLFFSVSALSQNILTDISKYDLNKIEKRTIKKSRKLLKTEKERKLFAFTYFAIGLSDFSSKKNGDIDNFLKNFKLSSKGNSIADDFFENFKLYDYRCYVYDDSLNIIAMAMKTNVFLFGSTTPDSRYIEYITRINPEYTFEYIFYPGSCCMYFCHKNGEIIIVRLSDDGENIISYPLSDSKQVEKNAS